MPPVTVLARKSYARGIHTATLSIPDGVSQVRVVLDRTNFAGAEDGTQVDLSIDLSRDGGNSWRTRFSAITTPDIAVAGESEVGFVIKDGYAPAEKTRLASASDGESRTQDESTSKREGSLVRFHGIPLFPNRTMRVVLALARPLTTGASVEWL